jgi:hypothetical protein
MALRRSRRNASIAHSADRRRTSATAWVSQYDSAGPPIRVALGDAVDFYTSRFAIGLTAQDRADVVALLQAL